MTTPIDNSHCLPLLGCIADDVTGATDLALNLVNGGMRVVQILGDRKELTSYPTDAIVVALKTRSIPKGAAIEQSLAALRALQQLGVMRFYFKYCSTFDSTEQGNIGPVTEALMNELGVQQTVFCPAFPRAGRTVYQGHLFVADKLLCESGMENHPLNPMTDANLVRFLSRQVSGRVGLVAYDAMADGGPAIQTRMAALAGEGIVHVVTDACDDSHLAALAQTAATMPLVTGGSGLARYLPQAYRAAGILEAPEFAPELPNVTGRSLIVAGSCSAATNAQVAWMNDRCPRWTVDVPAVLNDESAELEKLKTWASASDASQPLLITSTEMPDAVAKLQNKYGVERVASAIEHFLGTATCELSKQLGVRRFVLAGGETSGAIANRLGIEALRIGPEICAGVPWTETIDRQPKLALAFKSGNFGNEDFFTSALEMLP